MSRSYKKNPIMKNNRRGRKDAKQNANRKVRRTMDIPSGKFYNKVYNQYDVYDYISYWTLDQAQKRDQDTSRWWDLKETSWERIWYQCYYRK